MLKFFNQPIEVDIEQELVDKAKEFASKVVGTCNYKESNQSNKKKIETDHMISKLGEEAVCKVLQQYSNNITSPDYEIYIGRKKSWAADLKVNEIDLGVKTQKRSSAIKYELSWTFQCSEIRKDPILKDPESWVCFVQTDDLDHYHSVVYPPYQIKELVFEEPKLDWLKNKKKVVYAKNLPA